jgi:hypothetical protein
VDASGSTGLSAMGGRAMMTLNLAEILDSFHQVFASLALFFG